MSRSSDAAIVAHEAGEEELGLLLQRLGQRAVVVGIEDRIGRDLVEVLQPQPLRGKARRQGLGARASASRRVTWRSSAARRQLALRGDVEQLRIRAGAPHEERQPRRQLEIGQPVRLPGPGRCRRVLETEQELRAGQDGFDRLGDAGFEVAIAAPGVVEAHQPGQFRRGWAAPTERRRGQAAHDAGGAGRLVGRRRRPAGEDPPAAHRVGHAGDPVRADHGQVAQVRQRRDADGDADLGVGQGVLDWRDQVVDRTLEALQEGGGEAVRAGRARGPARVFSDRPGRRLVHPRVDVEERHPRAVDRHLDLLAGGGVAEQDAERLGEEVEPEHVVAVGREGVQHREAAARAERRAVGAGQLRRRLRQAVGGLAGRAVGVAHGQRRDPAGGAQVAFEQRRREGLRVGDVVEAVADGVGRQQRRRRRRRRPAGRARRGRTRRGSAAGTAASPGLGLTAANSSIRASSACSSPSSAPSAGRLAPAGGIIPARSLRTIFSAVSGDSCARIALKPASDSPPALARSLWQVAQ